MVSSVAEICAVWVYEQRWNEWNSRGVRIVA